MFCVFNVSLRYDKIRYTHQYSRTPRRRKMNCPYCSYSTSVTNSRQQKKSNSVWRRRECRRCHAVWTTEEHFRADSVFKVSADELLLDFAPEKLTTSLYKALKHRKTADSDASHLSRTVMNKLQEKQRAIIPKALITETILSVLKNYDKLAADLYKATHEL
jgi:transcriptional regulator NrdR family protein